MRELTLDDLWAIQELSDSMDMLNDPKIGSIARVLIRDSECYLFGAFKDEVLVGVGGLRNKGTNLAWIEDIRVHGDYQKTGIGTELFRYGERIAKEQGYHRVGYQTVTENAGSCKIGRNLGFQRKHEMIAFFALPENLLGSDDTKYELEPISIEEALLLLGRIPNGPKEIICIGWSYAPIELDYFYNQPDMKFYGLNETIMLEFDDRDVNTNAVVVVKAMLYGAKSGVGKLLAGFISRNTERGLPLIFLCPENLVPDTLPSGFQYSTVWNGKHNIVVLFTKDLR
jgi:GNAT superfamily N-acetyltransferase